MISGYLFDIEVEENSIHGLAQFYVNHVKLTQLMSIILSYANLRSFIRIQLSVRQTGTEFADRII